VGYRAGLPQLQGDLFLTDGGIETTLIFQRGLELPLFAAFGLLKTDEGTQVLRNYYEPYVALARQKRLGFVLESPTWRASPRWATELGYTSGELTDLNRKATARRCDRRGRLRNRWWPGLLHDQLRPPDALREDPDR